MLDERAITCANDESLCLLISRARKRLVAVAPAFSLPVADTIGERWRALGADAVHVIVDVDPEVFRLGYGEFAATTRLEETARELGALLQRQPGIRIGLVISDDATFIYAPTAQLIEAGPTVPQTPNAIFLGEPPPQVERELGQGENGVRDQVIGQDKATRQQLQTVEAKLKENPPLKFDVARTMRVFNAYVEFVELHLCGTYITRKTVALPAELMGVADDKMRAQLRASFRIVPDKSDLSGEHLIQDRNLIAERYLHVLPKFGTVIKRCDKEKFDGEISRLRASVEAFKVKVKAQLQAQMDANQVTLRDAMLPALKKNCPKDWILSDGTEPDEQTLKSHLEKCLKRAFGSADRLITHMNVILMYKAVTHEMLNDPEFIVAAQKIIADLKEYHAEFDAACGQPAQQPALS